jgi:hypothetical protein
MGMHIYRPCLAITLDGSEMGARSKVKTLTSRLDQETVRMSLAKIAALRRNQKPLHRT